MSVACQHLVVTGLNGSTYYALGDQSRGEMVGMIEGDLVPNISLELYTT